MNSSPISATSDSGKGGGNVGGIGGSGGGGGNSAITSSKNPPSSSKKDQALIEQVVAEIRRDWNVMLQDDSVINHSHYYFHSLIQFHWLWKCCKIPIHPTTRNHSKDFLSLWKRQWKLLWRVNMIKMMNFSFYLSSFPIFHFISFLSFR